MMALLSTKLKSCEVILVKYNILYEKELLASDSKLWLLIIARNLVLISNLYVLIFLSTCRLQPSWNKLLKTQPLYQLCVLSWVVPKTLRYSVGVIWNEEEENVNESEYHLKNVWNPLISTPLDSSVSRSDVEVESEETLEED